MNRFWASDHRSVKPGGRLLPGRLARELPRWERAGSAPKWANYFEAHPGSHKEAINAVLRASGKIDDMHGTNLFDFVIRHLMGDEFVYIP